MRKVNSLAELKAEMQRLQQQQLYLEDEIKNDFNELKESLAPVHIASKMLVNKNTGILNDLVNLLTGIFVKKILFRKSNFVLKFIFSFLAGNSVNNWLHTNRKKIEGWISELILKSGKKNKDEMYERATEDIEY